MKIIKCDSCGSDMSKQKTFEAPNRFLGYLVICQSRLPFTFEVRVTDYQFCTTDLDFCNNCLRQAMINSLEKNE